jgi:CelD/BcsL family acetyltransferase involved in cellulose biosynthesis
VAAYESLRHALFGGQCVGWLNLDDLGTAVAAYVRLLRRTEPLVEGQPARPATIQRRYYKDRYQVELV